MSLFHSFLHNVVAMFAVAIIYSFSSKALKNKKITSEIVSGFIFSIAILVTMQNKFVLTEGVVFDARAIIVSTCAMFIGPVATLITSITAIVHRIWIGGSGITTGICTIISSALIGLIFFHLRKSRPRLTNIVNLYIFGVIVHINMLFWLIVLPKEIMIDAYKTITLPVLLLLPFGNLLFGKLLKNQEDQIRIANELTEKELLLSEMGKIAKIGAWEYNAKTRKSRWTGEACHIHDLDPDQNGNEEIGLNLYSKESRDIIEKSLQKALESGESYALEFEITTAKGIDKWVRIIGKPVFEGDKATKVRGSFQDITYRKKTTAELKRNENIIKEAQMLASFGAWEWNVETGDVWWSDGVYNIFGNTPDSFKPQIDSIMALSPPEQRNMAKKLIQKSTKSKKGGTYELDFFKQDGSIGTYFSTYAPFFDEQGKLIRIVGTAMDITQRKKTEQEIADIARFPSENPYPVLRINKAGEILYSNKAGEQLLAKWNSEVGKAAPEKWYNLITETLELDEGLKEAEEEVGEKLFLFAVSPVKESGYVNLYARDITERQKMEQILKKAHDDLEVKVAQRTEELSLANIRLKELDKLKSMFIASMSHELRTPLNSIIGFTGIVLQGMSGKLTIEQEKQLTMVKTSAAHLLSLINDVIDVSKIEADKVKLMIEAFDLSEVVQDVRKTLENTAKEHNLTVEVEGPESLTIKSDMRRIKQIVINFVNNAIKFTDDGRIDIKITQKDNGVNVSVSDTGIGIKEEDMDKLFHAFGRVYTENRLTEGSGLGLYLSKKIATMLGGEITIESKFGKGSTFTLKLPLEYQEIQK